MSPHRHIQKPKVTVVIPTYKAGAWIEETLESVARQIYPADHLEILVIDDASPDDTVSIARDTLSRYAVDGRVVAREKNAGAAATRNAGWKMASGDWIQFLDQDDLLAAHKIDLQAGVAADADDSVAVVYSNWRHFLLEDGCWQASGPINRPFVDDNPVLRILQQVDFGYVGPSLIRKSFLTRVGGFDEKPNLGEDCDLMLRLAMAGAQFRQAHSDEAAFFYRQSPNSLWRAYIKNVEAMRNLLQSFRNVEAFLRKQSPGQHLEKEVRLALAQRYSRFAETYFEIDPASHRMIMMWLRELGMDRPIGLKRTMRILSSLVGYERALQLRSAYRRRFQPFLIPAIAWAMDLLPFEELCDGLPI